MIISNFTLV